MHNLLRQNLTNYIVKKAAYEQAQEDLQHWEKVNSPPNAEDFLVDLPQRVMQEEGVVRFLKRKGEYEAEKEQHADWSGKARKEFLDSENELVASLSEIPVDVTLKLCHELPQYKYLVKRRFSPGGTIQIEVEETK